jgi:hypothetical protein
MDARGQRILDLLSEASRCARLGDYGRAAQSINGCILDFQKLMERKEKHPRFSGLVPKMTYSLETLLMMLERKDWVAAADIIDYEFIPLWKEALLPDAPQP